MLTLQSMLSLGSAAYTASTAYKASSYVPAWSEITNKPSFATVATSGSYNDLSSKPTIPSIPSVMTTTEGNTGTATTQRTIDAVNLKTIILNHSPAGSRPASDVSSWAKASTKPTYNAGEVGARSSTWVPSASDITGLDATQVANRYLYYYLEQQVGCSYTSLFSQYTSSKRCYRWSYY